MAANNGPINGFFDGLTSTRVAPAKTAYFVLTDLKSPADNIANVPTYLENKGCSSVSLKAFIGGIINRLCIIHLDTNSNGDKKQITNSLFDGKFATNFNGSLTLLAAGTDEEKVLANKINLSSGNSISYIADLVNAAKKKPITEQNVEGYFEMLGSPEIRAGPVVRFINDLRSYFPDLVKNDLFRAALVESKWTDYRLARVHAGIIIYEIIKPLKELGLISPSDEKLVENGRENKFDVSVNDLIPRRLVLLAAVYHLAAGTRIDGWIQGDREINKTPRAKVAAMRAMFEKYFEIQGGITVITSANDLQSLQAAVNGKF